MAQSQKNTNGPKAAFREPSLSSLLSGRRSQIADAGWATFTNAQFGADANFESATFLAANYVGAQFGQRAKFDLATFDGITTFVGAQFSFNASFYQAKFESLASFDCAQFKKGLSFDDARFGIEVSFQGAQFGGKAIFIAAQFRKSVSFNGTQFGDAACFDGARYFDVAQFEAWTRQRVEDYWRSQLDVAAVDARIKFAADLELRSDAFKASPSRAPISRAT